jgi:pheromone a factor receptor
MTATARERHGRQIFDYILSFGFPALLMVLEIVYQPNRYGIVRGLGCGDAHVNTWPRLVLLTIWWPIFSAIGSFYAGEKLFSTFWISS